MDRSSFTATASPPPQAHAALGSRPRVRTGSTLGRVEIVGPIGSGGMADVWLGRIRSHGGFERLVAVKTVHAHMCTDARSREMFLREATLAAMIRHANVVDVHDVGEVDGVLFQVMTLIEGENLAGLLARDRALPVGVIVSIVGDALLGLHAAHEVVDEGGQHRHLVHRDVSPQNILVGLDGVARVADFGIAKALASDEDTTGSFRGKFAYFSPEQASQAPLDRRSDVFSMGIILWEALTGTRLFRSNALLETIELILRRPIPDPRDRASSVPAPLAEVTMRALERDPGLRYPTAAAMAQDLTRAAREAGCLLPRPEVAAAIEAMVGDEVRERRAELMAVLPDARPADAAAAVSSAPPRPRAKVGRALLVGAAGLVVVGFAAFLLLRRMTSDDPAPPALASASAPSAAASAVLTEPAPTITLAASDEAPGLAATTKTGSAKAAPPRASVPARHAPSPRKAPFDQNPFVPNR